MHPLRGFVPAILALLLSACGEDPAPSAPTSGDLLAPTSDITLTGTHVYDAIVIPAGVTVTGAGDLRLRSRRDVEIAGTLRAPGRVIEIRADSAVTISGVVTNAGGAGDSAAISIIGHGAVTLDGARLTSSGSLFLSNDSTLTMDDFPDTTEAAFRSDVSGGDLPIWIIRQTFFGYENPARRGTDQRGTGGSGSRGRDIDLWVRGHLQILEHVTIAAQDGGDGGKGTDLGTIDARAFGGRGGRGGDVHIFATGEIAFAAGTRVRSGDGGSGGDAEATGLPRSGGQIAALAAATGGRGGNSGTIDVRARGAIALLGPLTYEMGQGGDGGDALATGADGLPAGADPAQRGGSATATGGAGGTSPNQRLRALEVGGLANLTLAGGRGGSGGYALAHGGKGGAANTPFRTGGAGGDLSATGGPGGNANLRRRDGQLLAQGGDAGAARLEGGNGGPGWGACLDPCQPDSGGRGGAGGDGVIEGGRRGRGSVLGDPGDLTIHAAGNGGAGGDGDPAGDGGAPGNRVVRQDGGVLDQTSPSFESGASGTPCTRPVGACCVEGGCGIFTCPQCLALGGEWKGAGSSCDPDPCEEVMGSCCAPDGTCTVTVAAACAGSWQRDGDCIPAPCAVQDGACCDPEGLCTIRTRASCDSLNHSFQGDGVWCAPNPCPAPVTGACCNSFAGCSMVTAAQCAALGYSYMGDGVPCSVYPCFVGCCYVDGTCVYISGTQCLETYGMVAGPYCDPLPCPVSYGACCYPSTGQCGVVNPERCTYYGGVYAGDGVACSPEACDAALHGACCFPDGTCTVVFPESCSGAFWGRGTDCDPNPCPPPEGACCHDRLGCWMAIEAHCTEGVWMGPNTTCAPDPCTAGACCRPDGSCTLTDEATCTAAGGEWWEHTQTCDPNPCPQPQGACCMVGGNCIQRELDMCRPDEGIYMGDGTTCGPGPCLPDLGACCLGENQCVLVQSDAACAAQNGLFLGPGISCVNPPSCYRLGACCAPDGTCRVVSVAQCTEGFQGFGTTCDPNPCPGGSIAPGGGLPVYFCGAPLPPPGRMYSAISRSLNRCASPRSKFSLVMTATSPSFGTTYTLFPPLPVMYGAETSSPSTGNEVSHQR